MSMAATARRVASSLKHEVEVNARHTADEPEQLGGTDQGPATAVEVNCDLDSVTRQFAVVKYASGSLTPDRQRRLGRLAETCPVRRALIPSFAFQARMTTEKSRAAAWPAALATGSPGLGPGSYRAIVTALAGQTFTLALGRAAGHILFTIRTLQPEAGVSSFQLAAWGDRFAFLSLVP